MRKGVKQPESAVDPLGLHIPVTEVGCRTAAVCTPCAAAGEVAEKGVDSKFGAEVKVKWRWGRILEP